MSADGIDTGRRRFLLAATSAVGGVGAVGVAVPFVSSWQPSARAQAAGAPVEVDVSKLNPGEQITVSWRGKPVWIVRRSPEMLDQLKELDGLLRDPASEVDSQQPLGGYATNAHRSINPEYLVLVGLCTHLGCVPLFKPEAGSVGDDWVGGFFCPCHGSKFDLAGRVFQGVPAPTNLVVPPYTFVSESVMVVGVDSGEAA
ncbi:ubiquinol-cytochrome c reductase iron-sulfur subunit [Pelagibaculum spongiae]|uniref:Ubiquinol-cytochrome c reductase iron-sulfur subunit n=1 Tax=Pelagibaculum spongiae TaxID=2080658 RepID=A0A2V1H3X6_9GAMM|nr:ubiquinol-cytochrome c reductase iron-sulfur subunit [Pelagibaculum spongiae]PVZ71887.1 ubiquinol-cytochrome c reductase iron-sulfur subunit [Pelagibaculum spongiae]